MRRAAVLAVFLCLSCYPGEYGYDAGADSFGYWTLGWQAHANYSGGIDLGDGMGWRITIPPLVSLDFLGETAVICAIMSPLILLSAETDTDLSSLRFDWEFAFERDRDLWQTGSRRHEKLVNEVSWELTAEGTYHERGSAHRLLAGLKAATSGEHRVRPYCCAGWTFHGIRIEETDESVSANGPYAGGGLDYFAGRAWSVGLDGRWHWVYAEGRDPSRLLTVELSLSFHW